MVRRRVEPETEPADEASGAEPLPRKAKNARMSAMAGVAKGLEMWKPARQVLLRVEAVPTIFPQFDHANRVGGIPVKRIITIHGESNHGKTIAALGFELSFLQRDHFVFHVDAEMTTPITWCEGLMSRYADHAAFQALRPSCFEEVDDAVREGMQAVGEAREKGRVPFTTSGLFVVDSIQKLVPKDGFKKLLKEGAEAVGPDGMGGRMAMKRAALLAQWMNELVPLAHDTNCAVLLIGREYEDSNASAQDKMYGRGYKIGGGKAPIYDSSMTVRIERAAWVSRSGGDDAKDIIGERHRMRIWRTKVAGKDDREVHAYFHTSNGKLVPEGFDRARDLVELGSRLGSITNDGKGAWLSWMGQRWNGQHQAVKWLHETGRWRELEDELRAKFPREEASE